MALPPLLHPLHQIETAVHVETAEPSKEEEIVMAIETESEVREESPIMLAYLCPSQKRITVVSY